jgi:hypothetical protein
VPGKNGTKIRIIIPKFEYRNPKQIQNSNVQNSKQKLQTAAERSVQGDAQGKGSQGVDLDGAALLEEIGDYSS